MAFFTLAARAAGLVPSAASGVSGQQPISTCRVEGLGRRVEVLGLRVEGLGLGVEGLGLGV